MISRLAVAFALAGAGIALYFFWLGPTVSPASTPLVWRAGSIDAGAIDVQFAVDGVDFISATDADEPALGFAALRRGGQIVTFDDANCFLAVERRGERLWALATSSIEGGGPELELLVSEDRGRTFEHRASIPKPNYQAEFVGWSVDGEVLVVDLSVDDEVGLDAAWTWGVPLLDRAVGPGRSALRSKNGGRTWRLQR